MSQPFNPQPRAPLPPAGSSGYETSGDAEAALAAQRELGPDYSDHIAAGLADRVEQLAAARAVDLRQAEDREQRGSSLERTALTQRFVTSLVSLGAGIPITASPPPREACARWRCAGRGSSGSTSPRPGRHAAV